MDKVIKHAKDIKADKIEELAGKVERAKTITFADYRGLTAEQIAELRRKIKTQGGEMIVTKNTLVQRALAKHGHKVDIKKLEGPTATIFAYEDEIAPIREIAESAKITELPKFKLGFFGRDPLDIAALEQLAKLPGKNVLQGKLVGILVSPIYGIVSVLSANLNNLVYALDQIRIQKESS